MDSRDRVRAWSESVEILTYGIGEPNHNPMFLDRRVYQGSSGAVYPYPVVEQVADTPHPQEWLAIFLENEFLRIMILPELGGRVQMALDKTNQYHFVYYNRVIKPALVGLAGPWISGGIEFNWPQHHRPNTYGPVEWTIEQGEDGAQTVWCSEIDRMYGTKGMHGLRLRPGRAFLEIDVKLSNRTDMPQTFLWWANPAVHVDENHQSMFPPDVRAVMDHGKRDSIGFPIANGEYYKVDYSPGTDISRYRNIPVPTSYMAYHSDYDFVGSYDHGRQAGLLHVCDHHVSPGKKQWTWGHGEFGQAWDRQLTDEDGPYIELMCGVYTDNQPDFSWLMPGEEKSFTQYFMPYKGVGRIGNATIDAVVGMELQDSLLTARAYVTAERKGARLSIKRLEETLVDKSFDGTPSSHFEISLSVPAETELHQLSITVESALGERLVAWQPAPTLDVETPDAAKPIASPEQLDSTESLYLAGKHLEQYRHATREPADYYLEALRRDPGDARCNTAFAGILIRRGDLAQARQHACRAIERLTRHNPNPYDGEPYFLLGLAAELLGKFSEAEDAYHKATWNAGWSTPAGLAIGRLLIRRGEFETALSQLRRVLDSNANDHRARHLEVALLFLLGEDEGAQAICANALKRDPFNFGVLWESARANGEFGEFERRIRQDERNYLALASDYASAGLYWQAIALITHYLESVGVAETPLPYYRRAYYLNQQGDSAAAQDDLNRAVALKSAICFPNQVEDLAVLQWATETALTDWLAPYYLGCLRYHLRDPHAAVDSWKLSTSRQPDFATAWRNLGLAYYNKFQDIDSAWDAYRRSFELDPTDARVLYELDQLAKRLGHPPLQRLERLERFVDLLSTRDDLYVEYVTLLNIAGRHQVALDAVTSHRFHPWEGGEGKVPAQYVTALISLALESLESGDPHGAIAHLEQALRWPDSLGEGKITGNRENDIHFFLGCAYQATGQDEQARKHWLDSSQGLSEPAAANYYNDQPPESIFFQGLSLAALEQDNDARQRFQSLLEYGRLHVNDEPELDFFAVSLPDFLVFDDCLTTRNQIHCHFMMSLGSMGLGETGQAHEHFQFLEASDPSHPGVWFFSKHSQILSQGKTSSRR